MYPSLWRTNEAEKERPSESCVAGCIGSLLLIVGGVWYWNHWTGEIKRQADEEVRRKFDRQMETINPQMLEEWQKEQQRRAEEWGRLQEAIRMSKSRP